MRHRQLVLLFICNCIPPFIGMGLFPLLPLYATQFGATRTAVGVYYAVVYAASLLGTLGCRARPALSPRRRSAYRPWPPWAR